MYFNTAHTRIIVIMLLQDSIEANINDPMFNFLYALKAPETKRQYPKRFEVFLNFLNLPGDLHDKALQFYQKAQSNSQWLQDNLMKFIEYQKQRAIKGEISANTIGNYYKATKLFCEMNNLITNWKIISRGVPSGRKAANDRAPTVEEIQKIMEYPDRRIKPIIYLMVSSGIRLGAWEDLKWKHIIPFKDNMGNIITAKIIVYPGDNEEYFAFITPEAYHAVEDWMNFRSSYGETITGESWVMRDIWQTTNIEYGANFGLATNPKILASVAIKRIIERALWSQKVRYKLKNGERRHEWKTVHGFRKFFKTRAEQVMKPANVEVLMGHSIGISDSYYRPSDKDILDDYLKAVDLLTINTTQIVLEKQITELKEKSRDTEYIIKAKLQEKDEQIAGHKKNDKFKEDALTHLSDQLIVLTERIQELERKQSR
jgi:integrase